MDDDFGSTKRDPSVLRQLINDKNEQPVVLLKRDSDEDCIEQPVLVNNNPKLYSGMEGVAKGVTSSPETGSHQPANSVGNRQRIGSSRSSVVCDTPKQKVPNSSNVPNIPNVVEYHLKVQSKPVNTKDSTNSRENNDRMRSELATPLEKNQKQGLVGKLSKLSIDNNVYEESSELPQVFQVKHLGIHDARGLWGIKHTRKPVDNMVAAAKSLPTDMSLPLVKLIVSQKGVAILPIGETKTETSTKKLFPIETISYGVQDLVYTRVFSMITVRDTTNFRKISPFQCHGFVCESKNHARQLTYALATAFQIYSQMVKARGKVEDSSANAKKRYTIDLRTPDQTEADLVRDSEA